MHRTLLSVAALLACLGSRTSAAAGFDLVVHFGEPPEVVDRTPPPADTGNYLGPGHPHAESFRFPLREFRILPLNNVPWRGFPEPITGYRLRRQRTWTCCPGLEIASADGSEAFEVWLLTPDSRYFEGGIPSELPTDIPLSGASKLSYDFWDPFYVGGGDIFGGGLGQFFSDVLAYDVRVISYELVPAPDVAVPRLSAMPNPGGLRLRWPGDAWGGYVLEQAPSPSGPWTLVQGVASRNAEFWYQTLPADAEGYFRLKPR
ncbi:MAG TPA: hypothetical protein PLX89_14130 [Verrucomicrobiota bacterium]|nr:hypothetical protein [Verrucomicrobiales bacterium]HRI14130.1 hypothetical protein [Verrucomicrobiota bacterium]